MTRLKQIKKHEAEATSVSTHMHLLEPRLPLAWRYTSCLYILLRVQ